MTLIAKLATPESKEKWLGYYQAMWGVGAMTGPLIGSVLYKFFGYELTFYVYGAGQLILGVYIWYMVKHSPLMMQKVTK